MGTRKAITVLAAFLTALVPPALGSHHAARSGRVLLVGTWKGKKGSFATIQTAAAAAKPGDWILVAPGDYHEGAGSRDGVRVTTADIHIRGMSRPGVIVDGTRPGARRPCASQAARQNLGPGRQGRNGIVVTASGVSVDNLTICNFVGGRQGRQLAFDGGYGSGKVGLGTFESSFVTATSTFAARKQPALYGIFVSNAGGPGQITHSYASNMADSAFHIGACPDCNAVFDHDTAEHSVIALSAINAGGRLRIEHSTFRANTSGVDLASEEDESSPPPQDGTCPTGGRSCTVVEHNLIVSNNDPNVPGGEGGVLRLIGAGVVIAGGRHDMIARNVIRDQGAYGIVLTPFPWLGRPATPDAHCQGGLQATIVQTPLCFFDDYGNLVAGNRFAGNGFFGNATNGDVADAGRGGRTAFFGALGAQIACATAAFGACSDGTVRPVIGPLTALARALHADSGALTGSKLATMRARYPTLTAVTAPAPPLQPSMPDPCADVPVDPWCPSH
jgi:hypothetical protein